MSRIFLKFFLRERRVHLTYSAVNSEGLVPKEVCFGLITKDLPVLSNTPTITIILQLFFMPRVKPVLRNILLHDHRRVSVRQFSVQFTAAFTTGWILSIRIDQKHASSCLLYTIHSTPVHKEQGTIIVMSAVSLTGTEHDIQACTETISVARIYKHVRSVTIWISCTFTLWINTWKYEFFRQAVLR